jgi:hypothetical protein
MGSSENPAPHHETPTFGNPDLPPEGMEISDEIAGVNMYLETGGAGQLAQPPAAQARFRASEHSRGDPREVPARRAGNRAAAIAGGVP